MIVESMNYEELEKEISRDFYKLRSTTELRLSAQYDKERRKFKIDKSRTYTKIYPVKTAAKNTWLLFISKAPSKPRYRDADDATINYIVYFYNSKGLTVINRASEGLELFYGHFFKRYNERMNYGIDNSIDIVKKFFSQGGFGVYTKIKKGDKTHTIGVTRDGFSLGELQHNDRLLVNKTFVSRDLASNKQDELEQQLLQSIGRDVLKDMLMESEDLTNANIQNAINGCYID
jgi:hypothetical protein